MPSRRIRATAVIRQLLHEEQGQDLLEYALLAATVGLGAVAGLSFLLSMLGVSYSGSLTNVGNLWESPNPAGS